MVMCFLNIIDIFCDFSMKKLYYVYVYIEGGNFFYYK